MEKILMVIAWTGWTIEDWKGFMNKINPVNIIFRLGWSREDWIDFAKVVVFGIFLWTFICAVFTFLG